MKRVIELRKRLENIDVQDALRQAIVEAKPALIEANREQLKKGLLTDGGRIGSYKSNNYIRKRQKKGLQTAYVDLKYTGTLYSQIDAYVTKSNTVMFSRVEYAVHMEDYYATKSAHIFGLTDENVQNISTTYIMPYLLPVIKKQLFK